MKRILITFLTALGLLASGMLSTLKAQSMKMNEDLFRNDPDLGTVIRNFAFDEVQQYGNLDTKTRLLVTLASNIACQAQTIYRSTLEQAWEAGVTPVELKEVLYQCVPYAGLARVADFIALTNDFLKEKGASLPVASQSTTTPATRFDKGLATQKGIFGPSIDEMRRTAPENQKHIQDYLSANCFGDYYTRTGLDVKARELLTYSVLISLGGCEPQVKGHIQGNLNVGNDKARLLAVTTQLLPYIGYPRTLNAIACLNAVAPEAADTTKTGLPENLSPFPIGGPNPPANAQYFIGQSYLAPLATDKEMACPIYNVTFEPGCRNNWHSHTGGQILIAVGGVGYYQEKGQPARRLEPGDVVEIKPNVVHWHGAAPDSWFSHLAIECHPQTNKNTWLEPVDDEQYRQATSASR